MKHIKYSILFLFFCSALFAQNQDCITALPIFTKESIVVTELGGIGDVDEEFENLCVPTMNIEFESAWYTFSAFVAGSLNFTIMPDNPDTDIDFYLFKSLSESCEEKEVERCNATACKGTNGHTGLAPDDSDLFENLNCDDGENAYCSEVQLEVGENYFLLVNNFTGNSGYTIVFCGTAQLGPDDTVCTDPILQIEAFSEKNYLISPNPTNGLIEIQDFQEIESISVLNSQGAVVDNIPKVQKSLFLDFPTGMYYLQMHLEDGKKAISKVILSDNY